MELALWVLVVVVVGGVFLGKRGFIQHLRAHWRDALFNFHNTGFGCWFC